MNDLRAGWWFIDNNVLILLSDDLQEMKMWGVCHIYKKKKLTRRVGQNWKTILEIVFCI